MKYFLLIALLILNGFVNAQEKEIKKITVIVITDSLLVTDQVFITGNDPQFGGWNPGLISLEKQADASWKKEFSFDINKDLLYKFTLGSWGQEALKSDNSVPRNNSLTVTNDTVITYKIAKWGSVKNHFQGQITGIVKYHRNMEGEGINPRDIIVWLPPSYDKEKSKRYPVLYIHDGQNIVDPLTSTFGVDWQVDETADSLIKKGKMKEIIIVGIYNTPNRTAEYSYTDSGYAYMKFIVEKLKPFIDENYRTLKDRKNTATMGSSMGGLISFMLVWEYSNVFSMAGCLSPAVKVYHFDYLPKVRDYNGESKPIKIFFYNGGINIEKIIQPGLDETIELLKQKGYRQNEDFEILVDKTADHNESAWAKILWQPLLFMFGKN
ncbi:MAG: alpha/beta hydrolase-fold protein [Ignavibacteriales bacterium]|nr:alpha/beta hydrolase-fold protein [Ignavibacteriales bacterium]